MKTRVALLILSLISALPARAAVHVWQESASVSVQLGVRDKYAEERDSSTITFRVTDESGKVYQAVRRSSGDEWTYVHFPEDFTDAGGYGKYSWQGLVDGKVVAQGKFSSEY